MKITYYASGAPVHSEALAYVQQPDVPDLCGWLHLAHRRTVRHPEDFNMPPAESKLR